MEFVSQIKSLLSLRDFIRHSNLVLFQVLFQHAARYSPLRIEHLFASISSYVEGGNSTQDAEMAG